MYRQSCDKSIGHALGYGKKGDVEGGTEVAGPMGGIILEENLKRRKGGRKQGSKVGFGHLGRGFHHKINSVN